MKIEKIVLATSNKHKIQEMKELLKDLNIEILPPPNIEIDETGNAFEENAIIKAMAIYNATKLPTLADDSGLEIDYLGKKPGVHSARFLGTSTPSEVKNKKILQMLNKVQKSKRSARFVCVIAFVYDGKVITERGTCEGHIAESILGSNGFGYDPVFVPVGQSRSLAEHSQEEKNKISHRGKALSKMKEKIKSL